MGTLLGAALLGGLVAVWPMALVSRLFYGWRRDILQIIGLSVGTLVAAKLTEDREHWAAALGAAGSGVLLYAAYEWITASSDAAKTTVISRHTGRRLPPL